MTAPGKVRLALDVTPAQKARLKSRAAHWGLSMTDYVTTLVELDIGDPDGKIAAALLDRELVPIGPREPGNS